VLCNKVLLQRLTGNAKGLVRGQLCGKNCELLSHDAGQDDRGGCPGFEAKYWPDAALDAPMVLFDPIIQVFTLADFDRLQPAPRAIQQAICGVTGNDSLQVGLATVNDDAVGSAMTCQRCPEEPLRLADNKSR
jgi:hypothetical protein